MLRNVLTIAIRNLFRHKLFSSLNLLGLSFAFAACLMIWLFVTHERNYDTFHENADRIYRINQTYIWGDDDALFGSTGPAVRQAILDEVPEFEAMTRVHTQGGQVVSITDPQGELIVYDEDDILAVDDNFLEIFTFPLIQGNPSEALDQPNSIVLTQSTAIKYFSTVDIIGKQIQVGESKRKQSFLITGVVADVPANSHIDFDFLLSMNSFPRIERQSDSWMWTTFVTFGLMRADADPVLVAEKVAQVPGKYLEAFLQKYRGISYAEFLEAGETWDLYIQPLTDIHLSGSEVYSRLNETSDKQIIVILLFVAGLIFSLSLINYMNLSTARATTRAKEVGVRKVMGSKRSELIRQFLVESSLFILISATVSILFVEISLPFVSTLTDTNLSLTDTLKIEHWLIFAGILLSMSITSSFYPAWVLSAFSPASALKSGKSAATGGNSMRNTLVAIQFSISIMMIASTFIISDQISYLRNLDLGFERENQLIIKNAQRLGNNIDPFTNDLKAFSQAENVTVSSDVPPLIFDFDNFFRDGEKNINLAVNYLTVDEHFLDTYGLSLTHGRNLSDHFEDSLNIIVNQQFVKSFEFDSPEEALQNKINYNNTEFTIVGVVDDFETSLSSQTYPTVILDEKAPIFRNPNTHITLRIAKNVSTAQMEEIVSGVNQLWLDYQSSLPFDYSFVNIEYEQMFEENIRFGKLMSTLSVLSTIIACLGLIGLVAFVLERRKKEIGIRKVLGASVQQIWTLLSSSLTILMLIGLVVGGSISWWMMDQWMQDFEVRKDITPWPILLSGLIMLVIALMAVSLQIINAAKVNPVEYLHEE
jgi:putative ABC transport system permease protein